MVGAEHHHCCFVIYDRWTTMAQQIARSASTSVPKLRSSVAEQWDLENRLYPSWFDPQELETSSQCFRDYCCHWYQNSVVEAKPWLEVEIEMFWCRLPLATAFAEDMAEHAASDPRLWRTLVPTGTMEKPRNHTKSNGVQLAEEPIAWQQIGLHYRATGWPSGMSRVAMPLSWI